MTNIPFFKYTSLGNNFVLVDETKDPVLTEEKKSQFAFYATNKSYGVGSDNFLVIQKCSDTLLAEIGRDRNYWNACLNTPMRTISSGCLSLTVPRPSAAATA